MWTVFKEEHREYILSSHTFRFLYVLFIWWQQPPHLRQNAILKNWNACGDEKPEQLAKAFVKKMIACAKILNSINIQFSICSYKFLRKRSRQVTPLSATTNEILRFGLSNTVNCLYTLIDLVDIGNVITIYSSNFQ